MDDQDKKELVQLHAKLAEFEVFIAMMIMPVKVGDEHREAITTIQALIEKLVEEYRNQQFRNKQNKLI